jgi:RNA polymerase sigma-70 factor (ECF subfamily)
MRDETADFIAQTIVDRRGDYYRIAYSLCGNRDDSMDAVSDMTVIAIEKYDTLKNKDAFMSWSIRILVNLCRKTLRRRKRIVFLDDLQSEPADPAVIDELSPDMKFALSSIKPKYREVVVFKELLGYSYKEIAAMMQIPVGTAQSRCDYGLKCMRKALGGSYDEEI